jgi:hypothetical protein
MSALAQLGAIWQASLSVFRNIGLHFALVGIINHDQCDLHHHFRAYSQQAAQ